MERNTLAWQRLQSFICIFILSCTFFRVVYSYLQPPLGPDGVISDKQTDNELLPSVLVAVIVRNKAHALPWFFGQIENLSYPKNRIAIWIRTDHNVDNSTEILQEWVTRGKHVYHSVDFEADYRRAGYQGEKGPCDWSKDRFTRLMKLRQEALDKARDSWADYALFIDADNILENPETLNLLMSRERTIISPMLNSSSYYSNYWCGMDEEGFYKRTPEYLKILHWQKRGTFPVPMVHSTILVNLRMSKTQQLAFYPPPPGYHGPWDDIIVFAFAAKHAGIQMYIDNWDYYGMITSPMGSHNTLIDEADTFTFLKLETMVWKHRTGDLQHFAKMEGPLLKESEYIYVPPKTSDKMGFDKIYMINLVRRPERRKRMMESLYELGIDAQIFDAVDGKRLNDSYLQSLGIKMLPNFLDPYGNRPLTMGEIGCFLSHYFIWQDIVKNKYKETLLFEDDVRFEPYFKRKLNIITRNMVQQNLKWELIYLGRKLLRTDKEPSVPGFDDLVYPYYSYWTLSYMITYEGAKKLLDMNPLSKLVPVDEYLPIMFNKHPEKSWWEHFEPRNLIAMSVSPLLVFPTHYTGESNYISDTEDSTQIEGGSETEQPNADPSSGSGSQNQQSSEHSLKIAFDKNSMGEHGNLDPARSKEEL